jgi:subtilase family serine protease
VFTGAGDWAAYTASADLGSTNLSVGNPDDSPDVTTVGGTTLPASQDPQVYRLPDGSQFTLVVPQERIWGWDYLWPAFRQFGALNGIRGLGEVQWAKLAIGGSGGGISRLFGMPAYQAGFPGIRSYAALRYLSSVAPSRVLPAFPDPLPFALPTDWAVDLAPTVVTARVSGSHRLEPDFAVDADPRTGFAVYMAQFATAFGSPWQQYGGTSFGGPQMNGVAALVNGLAGRRSGFWNPALYRAAAGAGSPFRPLTAQGSIAQTTVTSTAGGTVFTVPGNDNLRFTGLPGARYGMGGGLGVPDLGRLARALTR